MMATSKGVFPKLCLSDFLVHCVCCQLATRYDETMCPVRALDHPVVRLYVTHSLYYHLKGNTGHEPFEK